MTFFSINNIYPKRQDHFLCITNVNGKGHKIGYSDWGWCSDECPLGDDSNNWGTDETLTVTKHFSSYIDDPDLHIATVGLGTLAISLLILAVVIKHFGIAS